jgi:hypothetical protein
MTVGYINDDCKQFYEGKKKFWRSGAAINLVFFECRSDLGETYIKITANNASDAICAIATPLFLDTDKVRIIVENAAVDQSSSLSVRRMSGSAHPPHRGYIGLNKYALDLISKFLFDRVIVSVPKVPLIEVEFAIELIHKIGDHIAPNGKLDFELTVHGASPAIVSENIAAFEKKTALFVESAAVCHSTYQVARKHSIACFKTLRNFNIMKISDSRSNLPAVKDSKPKTLKSKWRVKDTRFGSLKDSFVEQGSEFLNSLRISARSGIHDESYRHQQSLRVNNVNIGVGEKFNGATSVKEAIIEESNVTQDTESSGSDAFPTIKPAKSNRSMNLHYADRRLSKNRLIHKIEEITKYRSLSSISPDALKEVQVEQSDKEPKVSSQPSLTSVLPKILPKLSKTSKDPKIPQTVGSK